MAENIKEIEVKEEEVKETETRDEEYVIDEQGFLVKKSMYLESKLAG